MDPNKDFVICIDACNNGLGGVLTQEGHIIVYDYEKLKFHKKNYATYDLELAVMIHALNMWHHHLIRKKFTLMMDNKGLKYLLDQPNLNARQARWLAFLSEYDLEIQHIKGKENKIADSLSRNVNFMATIITYKTNLEDQLEEGVKLDENYQNCKLK